jgi:hypothetical protein
MDLRIIIATGIVGAALLVPATPAQALTISMAGGGTSCNASASKSATTTRTYAGTCSSTQARIDRYISSYPTSYYGPKSGSSSYISSTSGVNSGNYGKWWFAGAESSWARL